MTVTKRFDGRVVIVTGGASGQGAAEAEAFARLGARVVVTDIRDDDGLALAGELGDAVTFWHHDVSEEESWTTLVDHVNGAYGRVDVLINNAGINSAPTPLDELSVAAYDRMYQVNQRAVFLGMRAVAATMRLAGQGSIINTASTAALRPRAGDIGYAATKFAVRAMTKVAAAELGPHGVRVNAICPGAIDTAMLGVNPPEYMAQLPSRVPLRRVGLVTEVADLAVFLASDAASYITGADFVIDGGVLL